MRAIRSLLLLLSFLLAVSGVRAGEVIWIEPDPPSPQVGETVRLRLYDGKPGAGVAGELGANGVASFQRLWNSGRADLLRESAEVETARFRVAEAGLQLVVLTTRPLRASKSAERTTYFCKSFVVVGGQQSAGQVHFSEVGQRLEIVPQTDPAALARGGGNFELQVLFEREPLAGVDVFAVRRGSTADKPREARTDEIGLARLRLEGPGVWLIYLEHRVRCEDCGAAGHERLASSLVLSHGGS